MATPGHTCLNRLKTTVSNERKVKEKTAINVRLPDDQKHCDISGSCLTEDKNYLLLADFNNKKLKRMDLSTKKVKDFLSLPAEPTDICSVSNENVAVSLDNQTVKFVSVGDNMAVTRSLTLDHYCYGLAYYNEKLFISDFFRTVYIHDMNGREMRKISKDDCGNDIFQDSRHLAVSAAGDRVYVADFSNGMITLDIEGNYLSTLSQKDIHISDCYGVCTDGKNVFICDGYWPGEVVEIGQDDIPMGEIADVDSPESLCFDPLRTKLYVTGNGDQLTVLQLN